jgi:DNA gyrase/topoisomerase IV subunit A
MSKKGERETYDIEKLKSAMLKNITDSNIGDYNTAKVCVFAANVNLMRHINEIRDGLKPVMRRILMAMYDLKLKPNKAHSKSAAIVGETIKKYHQ